MTLIHRGRRLVRCRTDRDLSEWKHAEQCLLLIGTWHLRKLEDECNCDHSPDRPVVRRWRWLLRIPTVRRIRGRRRSRLGTGDSSRGVLLRWAAHQPVIIHARLGLALHRLAYLLL